MIIIDNQLSTQFYNIMYMHTQYNCDVRMIKKKRNCWNKRKWIIRKNKTKDWRYHINNKAKNCKKRKLNHESSVEIEKKKVAIKYLENKERHMLKQRIEK